MIMKNNYNDKTYYIHNKADEIFDDIIDDLVYHIGKVTLNIDYLLENYNLDIKDKNVFKKLDKALSQTISILEPTSLKGE